MTQHFGKNLHCDDKLPIVTGHCTPRGPGLGFECESCCGDTITGFMRTVFYHIRDLRKKIEQGDSGSQPVTGLANNQVSIIDIRNYLYYNLLNLELMDMTNAEMEFDELTDSGPTTIRSKLKGTGDVAVLVTADNLNNLTTYKIMTTGTTEFGAIGAPDNVPGTVFTATAPGTGNGTAYEVDPGTSNGVDDDLVTADNILTFQYFDHIQKYLEQGAQTARSKYVWDDTFIKQYIILKSAAQSQAAEVGDIPGYLKQFGVNAINGLDDGDADYTYKIAVKDGGVAGVRQIGQGYFDFLKNYADFTPPAPEPDSSVPVSTPEDLIVLETDLKKSLVILGIDSPNYSDGDSKPLAIFTINTRDWKQKKLSLSEFQLFF
jgi:hypothetical protein